jgi:glycosyltransferase involved in cell wall biosynthesis
MTGAPDVTVIIPTRNRRALLQECLDSLRRQEGVPWEAIVVDDASTDDSWRWLAQLDDPRVSAIRQEVPQRQAVARNRALPMARGRHVLFLDDDDLLTPGALAVLSAALDANPQAVAAVGAREDWFTAQGYRRRQTHPRGRGPRDITMALLAGWSAIPSQTLLVTDVVRAVGGYAPELVPCDDRDLMHKVTRHGPVVLCPEVVVIYRITPTQWRPANVRQLRERVARRAIRELPKSQWRRALRIRRLVRLVDDAEDRCTTGSPLRALTPLVQALLTAPTVLLSPMIGPWVARRLAGRLARRLIPAPSV